jgi:nucleoside-triphosphatase THEP1
MYIFAKSRLQHFKTHLFSSSNIVLRQNNGFGQVVQEFVIVLQLYLRKIVIFDISGKMENSMKKFKSLISFALKHHNTSISVFRQLK